MEYRYRPNGVCSSEMIFIIDENNNIQDLKVNGGCNGNLKGISELLKGMNIDDVIKKLSGIKCGFRNTSCPDQISKKMKKTQIEIFIVLVKKYYCIIIERRNFMIYIIRHGQTDWNIEHRTQGQTDIALNTNGIKQAELITQKISNLKIDNIISSDLKRAYMTAQIINENFNKTIETDKRLREFCFGTLEGITRDKITQEIWDDFNKNPKQFNAETKEEIFNRIESFINDIKTNNINKNTLIVTHGGPIRMIKYYLDNGDNFNDKKYLDEYMNLKIKNLDLFSIDKEMNFKKYDL